MYDINGIVADALSAREVQDDERRQELVDEVSEYFSGRDAFAAEVINYDASGGEASSATTVWNDEIRRVTTEVEQAGQTEILVREDNNDMFIKLDMGGMLSMLGGEEAESSEDQYIHMGEDDVSEIMDFSIPENNDYYEYVVQNGDVLVNGDTVIFECYIGTEDVDWLNWDDFNQDAVTDGVNVVLAYSLEEERPIYNFESVQNTDANNIHVIETFLYGVSFNFHVPSVGDDNVVDMGDMMGSLGSGLGGGLGDALGGGLGGGDGLGGGSLDGALDDMMDGDSGRWWR